MEIVNIHYLRLQCSSLPEDDALLEVLADAAEEQVQVDCNKTLDELRNDDCSFPAKLTHAVGMLVAHWYRVRETVTGTAQHDTPYGYKVLIQSLRKYRPINRR